MQSSPAVIWEGHWKSIHVMLPNIKDWQKSASRSHNMHGSSGVAPDLELTRAIITEPANLQPHHTPPTALKGPTSILFSSTSVFPICSPGNLLCTSLTDSTSVLVVRLSKATSDFPKSLRSLETGKDFDPCKIYPLPSGRLLILTGLLPG